MAKEKEDSKEAAINAESRGIRRNIAKVKVRVKEYTRRATTRAITRAAEKEISGKREARDTEKEDTEKGNKVKRATSRTSLSRIHPRTRGRDTARACATSSRTRRTQSTTCYHSRKLSSTSRTI